MEKVFYPCEHDYDELEELICKDFQDKEPPDSMYFNDYPITSTIFCH
jgi:hypothetical protein